jgi:Na+-transporting methylmalonyl-CoA/oxaloacetate decarboxylase gamma subunit
MSDFTFGWTITVLGMGVTLATLLLLVGIILLLAKLFPYKKEEEVDKKGK